MPTYYDVCYLRYFELKISDKLNIVITLLGKKQNILPAIISRRQPVKNAFDKNQ